MRTKITSFISLTALALLGACSDRVTTSPTALQPRAVTVAAACTPLSATQIESLIENVFEVGSPNVRASLGKWDNIVKTLARNTAADTQEAKNKAINLIEFVKDKAQPELLAEGELLALLNAISCFTNLGFQLNSIDFHVVYPDLANRYTDETGLAGIEYGVGTTDVPTIVTIDPVDDLVTKLNKPSKSFQFNKFPAGQFLLPVTAVVCARAPLPVLARLRLGHNPQPGVFEILDLPAATPGDLVDCSSLEVASNEPSLLSRLASAFTPNDAFAQDASSFEELGSLAFGASGVGGSTREFSPIGPVDPKIFVSASATPATWPIGSVVAPAPSLSFRTSPGFGPTEATSGNALSGIIVNFANTGAAGATITMSSTSDASGVAAAAWRTGLDVGAINSISAAAQTGGAGNPAVPGVTFTSNPVNFSLTTTGPSKLAFTSAPSSAVAGVSFGAVVNALDAQDRLVEGYISNIVVGSDPATFLLGTTNRSATLGVATYDDLRIEKAGTYTLTASAPNLTSATSASFIVSAASAANILKEGTIVAQAPTGTTLGISTFAPPRVKVTDTFGNLVSNHIVYFTPASNLAVVSPRDTATDAAGLASTKWTLQENENVLIASLDPVVPNIANPTSRFTLFSVQGVTNTSPFLECLPGNTREPIIGRSIRLATATKDKQVTRATLYVSATGSANAQTRYPMRLRAVVKPKTGETLTQTVYDAFSPVFVRGNTAGTDQGNFTFSPAVPADGRTVVFSLAQLSNLPGEGPAPTEVTNSELLFNTGECGPSGCAKKSTCSAVVVGSVNPFTAAVVRQSVAIRLRSN